MTEIGLTKSERRYYEIGYDAGFKQSRLETIREVEGKLEALLDRERRYLGDAKIRDDDAEIKDGRATTQTLEEVKQILNSMKE